MGYRNYIAVFPKREYNKIKSLTVDGLKKFYNIELEDDGSWYKGVSDYGDELYEFGKYVDFNPPKKSMKPFFKDKELKRIYNDEHEFYIVTKEFLAYIIDIYKERIKKYYNDMIIPFLGNKDRPSEFLNTIKTEYSYPNNKYTFDFSKITEEEQTALYSIIEHVRSFRTEWVQLTPYNLERGDSITESWKFEYGIFELVRIYKSFDWKKNVMIYYGY